MKLGKLFVVFTMLLFASCEKPQPVADDDDDPSGVTDDNLYAGDGWYESNPYFNREYENGDTVNVRKFINADFDGEVWVKGYVIGCATGSGGYNYQMHGPYTYDTAILLGDSRWNRNLGYAIAVQLPSGSAARRGLNLKDNMDLDGRLVAVRGEKTTYLKLPGIKKVALYEIIENEDGTVY